MVKITAKNNNYIKDTKRLLTSSRARRENNSFVLEGARLCFDVLNSFYKVKLLLVTQSILDKYPEEISKLEGVSNKSFLITDEISEKLSETKTPQGIFAVCESIEEVKTITEGKYILLDRVQDPSNVGAMIRTGEALGIDGFITYDCCDLFNPKTLRASMGSILRMNVIDISNSTSFVLDAKDKGFEILASVPKQDANKITEIQISKSCICIVGNEANGVSNELINASDKLVTIPMMGRAESLNASVAGAILMWEMIR